MFQLLPVNLVGGRDFIVGARHAVPLPINPFARHAPY